LRTLSLRARWVFPVSAPPLENGTVEIAAGRIAAVHDGPGPCTRDLGNAAIIPGLVNAHTHLELSDLAAPLQPHLPFTSWLKAVMAHRRERTSANAADVQGSSGTPDLAAAVRGKIESAGWGTTTIGDIGGSTPADDETVVEGPRVVAFLELLGLAPERAAAQLERARTHLTTTTAAIRGLSPHAPYSVHPDLFRKLVELAVTNRAPLAMHVAETRAELELLSNGTGEFVAFLEELGVWRPDAIARGSRPLDYLRELARVDRGLAIHGNYLADDEIDFLAAHPNISVVYCPRTHAFFQHEEHPWRRLLARGVNVALGTDSRASNPDLGLWNEILFLRALDPDCDPALLLRLGTWNGAFAMGLEAETGSLEVGKSADLAVVILAAGSAPDPYALLFRSENQIVTAFCAGSQIDTAPGRR
jgi:cytosine/adenosine deaminase-related metal-dependent hydrolase